MINLNITIILSSRNVAIPSSRSIISILDPTKKKRESGMVAIPSSRSIISIWQNNGNEDIKGGVVAIPSSRSIISIYMRDFNRYNLQFVAIPSSRSIISIGNIALYFQPNTVKSQSLQAGQLFQLLLFTNQVAPKRSMSQSLQAGQLFQWELCQNLKETTRFCRNPFKQVNYFNIFKLTFKPPPKKVAIPSSRSIISMDIDLAFLSNADIS